MGIFFSQIYQENNNNIKIYPEQEDVEVEDKINPDEKGAYIFQDDEGRIYRFLYFKLSEKEMEKALPITYHKNSDRDYLLVTFDPEGQDYLGQHNKEKLLEIIESNKMTNLLTTEWQDIENTFNITEKDYWGMVDFAKEQMNS